MTYNIFRLMLRFIYFFKNPRECCTHRIETFIMEKRFKENWERLIKNLRNNQ